MRADRAGFTTQDRRLLRQHRCGVLNIVSADPKKLNHEREKFKQLHRNRTQLEEAKARGRLAIQADVLSQEYQLNERQFAALQFLQQNGELSI